MTQTSSQPTGTRKHGVAPILEVKDLVKHYPLTGGRVIRRRVGEVHATCGVSFDLYPGETIGLVGESGCGKSTTGKTILQLQPPTSGSVRFQGEELVGKTRKQMRPIRRNLQVVFQDPYASLNPRVPVNDIVAEPIQIHHLDGKQGKERVRELLTVVGLNPEHGNRYAHEFSGGQRQRLGAGAESAGPGRAGLRAGRRHPGGGREPAGGAPGAPGPGLPVHRARPVGGPPHLGPRRRDVPRQDRGDRLARGDLRARLAPLHAGAAVGGADPRPQAGAQAQADRAGRRRAEPREPAIWLPLPHPLLEGAGDLREGGAGADRPWPGAPGRLPLRGAARAALSAEPVEARCPDFRWCRVPRSPLAQKWPEPPDSGVNTSAPSGLPCTIECTATVIAGRRPRWERGTCDDGSGLSCQRLRCWRQRARRHSPTPPRRTSPRAFGTAPCGCSIRQTSRPWTPGSPMARRIWRSCALDPVPDLASGPYQISDDRRTYTFTIRKGIRYAPPYDATVQAKDFVYAIERQFDPHQKVHSPNPYASLIQGFAEYAAGKARTISGMQAIGESTLKITLRQPASDFPSLLTMPFFSPVPQRDARRYQLGEDYAKHLIATGSYALARYSPGERIELVRNQNWDPETDPLRKAWVDRVEVTIGSNESAIQAAIEQGDADLNLDLTLQTNSGPTANPLVRKAINLAVDKRALVLELGGAFAGEPASTILSPTLGGYEKYPDPYGTTDSRGDPVAARALLSQAGYPNGLTLNYVGPSTGKGREVLSVLQTSLAHAGIGLNPKLYKGYKVYTDSLQLQSKKDEHQIGLARWCPDIPGNGARSFIGVLLDGRKITAKANNNYGDYDNPTVNAMIDQAYATEDPARRNSLWGQIDRKIMDDAAWVPLVYERQTYFWSSRVKQWLFSPWISNPDITNLWLDPNQP